MSSDPITPAPLPEVHMGDGRTVISYEGGTLYRVRMPSGEVQAFAPKVEATPENAVDDIVTNPPPAVPSAVVLSPLKVISRLTTPELLAIATSTDPQVAAWRLQAIAAQEIRTDDPRTAQGFALLISKGILTADRPAQLMAP